MIRIKNWNSCIPDELRKTDFMSVYPFPSVIKLRRVLSPFLRGVTGPGSIGEAGFTGGGGEAADDDGDDGATPSAVDSAAKKANKKVDAEKELRRLAAMSGQRLLGTPGPAAPGSPFHSGTPAQSSGPRTVGQTPHPLANPRTQALTAAQLLRGSSTPSHGQHGYQGHPSGASTPMGQHNRGSSNQQHQQPYHSAPGHHQQGANGRAPYGGQAQQGPMAGRRAISDRSVVGNSGGAQWVTHVAAIDAVSESTGQSCSSPAICSSWDSIASADHLSFLAPLACPFAQLPGLSATCRPTSCSGSLLLPFTRSLQRCQSLNTRSRT